MNEEKMRSGEESAERMGQMQTMWWKECARCAPVLSSEKTALGRRKEIDVLPRALFQGKEINTESVQNILISRTSIKEYLNQPHKHFVETEYLGEHAPYKRSAINRGVVSEHILGITIAGETSYLIVWEFEDGRKILHGVSDSDNVLKQNREQPSPKLQSGLSVDP